MARAPYLAPFSENPKSIRKISKAQKLDIARSRWAPGRLGSKAAAVNQGPASGAPWCTLVLRCASKLCTEMCPAKLAEAHGTAWLRIAIFASLRTVCLGLRERRELEKEFVGPLEGRCSAVKWKSPLSSTWTDHSDPLNHEGDAVESVFIGLRPFPNVDSKASTGPVSPGSRHRKMMANASEDDRPRIEGSMPLALRMSGFGFGPWRAWAVQGFGPLKIPQDPSRPFKTLQDPSRPFKTLQDPSSPQIHVKQRKVKAQTTALRNLPRPHIPCRSGSVAGGRRPSEAAGSHQAAFREVSVPQFR